MRRIVIDEATCEISSCRANLSDDAVIFRVADARAVASQALIQRNPL